MNKKLAILFVLVTTVSAFAASEEKINRQLDVHPGGKLVVDVDFGTIDISAGADDKVTVDASRTIDFGDEAKEKEYVAAVPITISAEGNVVTVQARSAKESYHLHFHHTSMDGRYTIRIPKNFAAELDTGGGKITANDLVGDVRADSGGGELKFSHLHGAVLAKTGGGSIQMDGCDGATEIKSGGGDVVLKNGRGLLRARTGGGVIEVRDYAGDADVETGGGELILQKSTEESLVRQAEEPSRHQSQTRTLKRSNWRVPAAVSSWHCQPRPQWTFGPIPAPGESRPIAPSSSLMKITSICAEN
jgi:hypothetical protein